METGHNRPCQLDRRLAPLLLFGNGRSGEDHGTFVYSLPRNQLVHLPSEPGSVSDTLRGHRVCTTSQGWMLMARRLSPETFLWDPFTGSRISLPPDHDGTMLTEGRHRLCLLSRRRPTDPGCVVLVVDLDETVLWYCRLITS
uniref:KIB1-4 beta-propeller domain-containing protein n=1 Tax=Leersia perrieri TaxID=77586 RepID=A0A0D9XDC6_9ORYZ